MSSDSEIEQSTCGTVGCYREPVVVYRYSPGTDEVDYEETRLCLPCRRVVEFSRGIPWNDATEVWHDKVALGEYNREKSVIRESGVYDSE